jgi:hypothetical protein
MLSRWSAILALVGAWAFPGLAATAQVPSVLSDISGVTLRIRLEGAAGQFPGLAADDLEGIVRAGLRSGGIEVSDDGTHPDRGQAPLFEILLIMYHDSARASRYAFSVTGTLTEGVTLRRGEGGRVWAQTWSAGTSVGIVGANAEGLNLLRLDVRELVDRFVRDVRSGGRPEEKRKVEESRS